MTLQNDGQFRVQTAATRTGGVIFKPDVRMTSNAPALRGGKGLETDFAKIFDRAARQERASGLKLSKHAEARLFDRNIRLSETQKAKIADALAKAEQKGVKDALVMIDDLAIVANAKTMTVITAVGKDDLQKNIFTNIDGAVFA